MGGHRPRRWTSGLLVFASLLGVAALVRRGRPARDAPAALPPVQGARLEGEPLQGESMMAPAEATPADETLAAAASAPPTTPEAPRSRRREAFVEPHQQDLVPKAMEVDPERAEYLLGRYRKLSFDVLGNFDYEPPLPGEGDRPSQIPAEIQALSGGAVAIEGYMTPLDFTDGGSTRFVLMNQPPSCCFGGAMRMNDWILVAMEDGRRVKPSSVLPVIAVGELEVEESFNEYGEIVSIYAMKAADVYTSADGDETVSRLLGP